MGELISNWNVRRGRSTWTFVPNAISFGDKSLIELTVNIGGKVGDDGTTNVAVTRDGKDLVVRISPNVEPVREGDN